MIAALCFVSACSGDITGARDTHEIRGVVTLPEVTGTGCRYGGDYPYCNDPPSGGNDGSTGTPPGGGTQPDPGVPTGGGDSSGDSQAYAQGPIAWGGCILGIVGSTVSIYDVADKFESWYNAYQDAQGAYNLWMATVQNNADPVIQQLYEYQYRQAVLRQNDAKEDVVSATQTSGFTLGGAALVCGALALAPTP